MKYLALALIGCLAASGCSTARKFQPSAPFDEAAARAKLQGSNTVAGSALMRQRGGGMVTCAGNPVYLMPAGEAAKEWANYSFGGDASGYREISFKGPAFVPRVNPLSTAVREVRCDTAGKFSFDGVGDGPFYVIARITWMISAVDMQGGDMFTLVDVSGGKRVEVVLAP